MIRRSLLKTVTDALFRQAAVALLGPRQVGKTTLAMEIAETRSAIYLDLESPSDREKLRDAELYLADHPDKLVILDEIHRIPEVFKVLRGIIDQGRRQGNRTGRFLLLGSASMELLRQSGESLAGRITYISMTPLGILEVSDSTPNLEPLWVRGGFPDSFLAQDEAESLNWREDFIRSYLERDIPQLGPRIPAETLRRFWTMLAHAQGAPLNAARLASGLGVSGQTIGRYTDLLVDLLLVRRLLPYHANTGKRLVKSPKVYVRDSGVVHALLSINDREALLGHPVAGPSWEGYVIENLINAAPARTVPSFYRTAAGAEIDLILELPGGERWAIEIKRSMTPKLEKGFHHAKNDLQPSRSFVVYSGRENYRISEDTEAISLYDLSSKLAAMTQIPAPEGE